MEIAVGLLGLVGAVVGLATALISRKQEVVVRQEYAGEVASRQPGGLGVLVFRSTLFGFAIGTFFGVMALSTILVLGKLTKDRDEAMEQDRVEAYVRVATSDEGYRNELRKQYPAQLRRNREDRFRLDIQAALLSLPPCSLLGTLVGLFIGMKLARLSAGAVPRTRAEQVASR